MAIILALNSHSLRLRLRNCRVSLVDGVSCVWEVRQTLVFLKCMFLYCKFFWGMFVYSVCSLSSSSAHFSGCVVNGPSAMAAS